MSIFKDTLSFTLNAAQEEAVKHHNGPALVLAVPGSGKTTILICRTVQLIHEHHVDPKRILSLTFSKAAALDMQERYNTLFSQLPYKIGFSTIHRFCYSVLLSYFKQIKRDYVLLESKESKISKQQMLKEIYKQVNHGFMNDEIYEELTSGISYIKNMLSDPTEYSSSVDKFDEIYALYESRKKENFLMDFDDMLTMCHTLLTKKPQILEFYQNKFDYIQVDESQDTSKVQHEVIQLLAKKHNNIYMVADDDQSIYGFRGAYPDAIVNIDSYYPNTKKYLLGTNYRSSKDIISICAFVIANNKTRHQKDFLAFHQKSADIKLIYADTTEEQVGYIVDSHKKSETSEAILFRNNLSLIPLADRLNREDVDFVIKDFKHHFFNNWCTQDILAFMKVAMVPNDIQSFERIYYKMNAYLSKVQLQYIKDKYNGINLFDTLIQIPNLEPYKLKTLRKIKSNFENLSKLRPELAIEYIEDELNYKSYLTEHCKKNNLSIEAQNKTIDILKVLAAGTDSLVSFIERLDDLKRVLYTAANNKNPHALKLFTMHGSKGLEFDHVYIVDLDDHIFPSKYATDCMDKGDLSLYEEERRLFYVALSRAKSQLSIVHTKFRNGKYNKTSPFVKEFIDGAGDLLTTENFSILKKQKKDFGFKVGDKILHTSFGVGILVDIDDDRIMIEFKDSTKVLSADLCLDSKIIIKMK